MAELSVGVRNANTYSGDKELSLTSLSKTNITQDELDGCIQFIQLTATVVAIGDDTSGGFNAGASDVVHILSEGPAPAAARRSPSPRPAEDGAGVDGRGVQRSPSPRAAAQ